MELTITTPPTPAEKPAEKPAEETLILGKFKSQADLEKAYTEAEKKITELGQKKPEAPLTPEAAKNVGVDLDAIAAEYATNGEKLSPETLASLEAKGFPKAVVDNYINGQKALTKQFEDDIATVAGGMPELQKVLVWARTGLSKEEAAAYDASLAKRDAVTSKLLMRGIVDKFFQANGRTPNLVTGGPAGPSGGETFDSQEQIVLAMRDKRYKTDSKYRDSVIQKIKNSETKKR